MSLIRTSSLHHLRLTVTDIDRSRTFYQEVLGLEVAAESPGDADDPAVREDRDRLYGGVVFRIGEMMLGLRPVAQAADRFDSTRVGLDHLSFTVSSVEVLDGIAARLATADVEHGEVRRLDDFGIAILSFSDPDGIHLELSAPI